MKFKFVVYVTICHRGNYPIREDRLSFTIVFRRKETIQIQWLRTRQLTARKRPGKKESSGETCSVITTKVILVYISVLFF